MLKLFDWSIITFESTKLSESFLNIFCGSKLASSVNIKRGMMTFTLKSGLVYEVNFNLTRYSSDI